MKRTLLYIVFMFGSASLMYSQTLYSTVYERAKTEVTSGNSASVKTIGQYKVRALDYMVSQAKTEGKNLDNRFMDMQAVNLESFISDFQQYVHEAAGISEAKKQEIIKCYTTASFSYPMFPNASPLVDGGAGELLPFSLNTDWTQAYDNATTVAKQVLRKK